MENNLLYLPICWAAQRAGLYFTCISSRLTAGEVEYIVKDCAAKVLIAGHTLTKVAAEVASLAVEHFMVGGTIDGYRGWEEAARAMPSTPIADESAGVDMLYSSGTTGRPKGVRQPLAGLPIDAPNPLLFLVQGLFGFSVDTIYLSPAPLYHAAPLRYCMTVHRGGGTVVVMEHFEPEAALKYIAQYKANASQFVPTMFVRMLKLPDETRLKYDVSSMKSAIHAAAPCPVDVKRRMIEWWGPVIHEYYGGTEGNGLTYASSADWLAHPGHGRQGDLRRAACLRRERRGIGCQGRGRPRLFRRRQHVPVSQRSQEDRGVASSHQQGLVDAGRRRQARYGRASCI